jgi:hypothetical protein
VSVTYTWPNPAVRQLAQAQVDALNAGFTSVGCFTSPSSISDTTALASLGLFTGSGFSLRPATFTPAALDGSGTIATYASGVSTFTLTATVPPTTIQGVFYSYTDTALGSELIAVILMPNGPLVISQIGDNVVAQLSPTDTRAPGQP